LQQGKSSQVDIHGNNYEVNINRPHNAQNDIDIGNADNAIDSVMITKLGEVFNPALEKAYK